MKLKRWASALIALVMLVSTVPAAMAATPPNSSMETAILIEDGETVEFSLSGSSALVTTCYYSVNIDKASQMIAIDLAGDWATEGTWSVTDSKGQKLQDYDSSTSKIRTVTTNTGTHYISVQHISSSDTLVAGSFLVRLVDNDANEANNTQKNAYAIKSGESVELKLLPNDQDWFVFETSEDGQDVRIDISGFDYATTGYAGIYVDDYNGFISKNTTDYYHLTNAGTHYIFLYPRSPYAGKTDYPKDASSIPINLTLTVTVLDGDENESNDTQSHATTLPLNTDKTFMMGGAYDEDWFQFEVDPDPNGSNLYTLQFLDLNPDYSDEFTYTVYAPNGTIIEKETHVNIQHSNILQCNQQGLYFVKIACKDSTSSSSTNYNPSRSPLRIRVKEGGNDPYEDNNTWLKAKPIQPGQMIQHVLENTSDKDWFYFAAEENDMSFSMELDQTANVTLYRAEDLVESDTYNSSYESASGKLLHCKLDRAGIYYVQLGASSSDISSALRTFMVNAESPNTEEPNDTWDTAKRLFEKVPQPFDIAGGNDIDWFKIVVPEGVSTLNIAHSFTGERLQYSLYREQDIIEYGLNVSAYETWKGYDDDLASTIEVSQGTYYLNIELSRGARVTDGLLNISFDDNVSSYAGSEYFMLASTDRESLKYDGNLYWEYEDAYIDGKRQSLIVSYDWNNDGTKDSPLELHTLYQIRTAIDDDYITEIAAIDENSSAITAGTVTAVGSDAFWLNTKDSAETKFDTDDNTIYVYAEYDESSDEWSISEGSLKDMKDDDVFSVWVIESNSEYAELVYIFSRIADSSEGATIDAAIPLASGTWSESTIAARYYSLGALTAGNIVRINWDGFGSDANFALCDSSGVYCPDTYYDPQTGTSAEYEGTSLSANRIYQIPADGDYYLYVGGGSSKCRIRYDIGSGIDTATDLEAPDAVTLLQGQNYYVDLRLSPYDAISDPDATIYTHNNSDPTVAEYNENTGYITTNKLGTTTITFRAATGNEYLETAVTVHVVTEEVSIVDAPNELSFGESTKLSAKLTPAGTSLPVIWSSSDDSILYVFPGGKVVAVGEGTATITASTANDSDSVTITVTPEVPSEDQIKSIMLSDYDLTLYKGEGTQTLSATVLPEGIETEIVWVSSNTSVATVSQSGVVTAVAPGISIITASAGDHNASCIVTVQAARVRVTGITFDTETLQIPRGSQTTLIPVITPSDATTKTLTWVSDDNSVATVSRTGIVKALAIGKTTIRATTLDGGYVAEITIEVTAAPQDGDINGDGYIDAADAMITLQVAVGKRELTAEQEKIADVTGDGWVDAADAVRILRYDAGLVDKLRS